jgi:hypothetical protein
MISIIWVWCCNNDLSILVIYLLISGIDMRIEYRSMVVAVLARRTSRVVSNFFVVVLSRAFHSSIIVFSRMTLRFCVPLGISVWLVKLLHLPVSDSRSKLFQPGNRCFRIFHSGLSSLTFSWSHYDSVQNCSPAPRLSHLRHSFRQKDVVLGCAILEFLSSERIMASHPVGIILRLCNISENPCLGREGRTFRLGFV